MISMRYLLMLMFLATSATADVKSISLDNPGPNIEFTTCLLGEFIKIPLRNKQLLITPTLLRSDETEQQIPALPLASQPERVLLKTDNNGCVHTIANFPIAQRNSKNPNYTLAVQFAWVRRNGKVYTEQGQLQLNYNSETGVFSMAR